MFLLTLLDGIFYAIGKGFWWGLRKIRIPIAEFGHWGYVALGIVVFIVLVVVAFFVAGSLYVK